jgi:hypothetical protein
MHVVNAGIDAGFKLAGDILEDPDFNQAPFISRGWKFSSTND